MAVASEPAELAFVGIEVLHPELGGIGVRRVGGDRLDIDTCNDAVRRDDHFDRRVAVEVVAGGEQIVVPVDGDGRGALGDCGGFGVDGHEIALVVESLEVFKASLGSGIGGGTG
jgi:hypothetical protein